MFGEGIGELERRLKRVWVEGSGEEGANLRVVRDGWKEERIFLKTWVGVAMFWVWDEKGRPEAVFFFNFFRRVAGRGGYS